MVQRDRYGSSINRLLKVVVFDLVWGRRTELSIQHLCGSSLGIALSFSRVRLRFAIHMDGWWGDAPLSKGLLS